MTTSDQIASDWVGPGVNLDTLSEEQRSILFCFLCSDDGEIDLQKPDWCDTVNYIRGKLFNIKHSSKKENLDILQAPTMKTLIREISTLWSLNDEIEEFITFHFVRVCYLKNGCFEFVLSNMSKAILKRYARTQGYTREPGESCFCVYNEDRLLLDRLEIEVIDSLTLKDENSHAHVGLKLQIPRELLKSDLSVRKSFMEFVRYRNVDAIDNIRHLYNAFSLMGQLDDETKLKKLQSLSEDEKVFLCCMVMSDFNQINKDFGGVQTIASEVFQLEYITSVSATDALKKLLEKAYVKEEYDAVAICPPFEYPDIICCLFLTYIKTDENLEAYIRFTSGPSLREFGRLWHYIRKDGEFCFHIPVHMNKIYLQKLSMQAICHCMTDDPTFREEMRIHLKCPPSLLHEDISIRIACVRYTKQRRELIRKEYAKCKETSTDRMQETTLTYDYIGFICGGLSELLSDKFQMMQSNHKSVLFCLLLSKDMSINEKKDDWVHLLNAVRSKCHIAIKHKEELVLDLRYLAHFYPEAVQQNEDLFSLCANPDDVLHSFTLVGLHDDEDLLFFLNKADVLTLRKYGRLWHYRKHVLEKCVFFPDDFAESYIKKLNFYALSHVMIEEKVFQNMCLQILHIPMGSVIHREERTRFIGFLEERGTHSDCERLKYRYSSFTIGSSNLPKDEKPCFSDIEKCILFSILFAECYTANTKGFTWRQQLLKIAHHVNDDASVQEGQFDDILSRPDSIIWNFLEVKEDLMRFSSPENQHFAMFVFVEEYLRTEEDLKFFIETAHITCLSEYGRLWHYRKKRKEKCLYIPDSLADTYIRELNVEAIIHCMISDPIFQGKVITLLHIPKEILDSSFEARCDFVAISNTGNQRVYNARGMIVGCAGAGKTTLLKRLQGANIDELNEVQTTIGLEIHHYTFEVDENVKKMKKRYSDLKDPLKFYKDSLSAIQGKKLLSFLDFGGQCAYYACHQVYFGKRSVCIIVVDFSKEFENIVDFNVCDQRRTMFANWKYKDYFVFWLQSVRIYCGNKTPVIIVATHCENYKSLRKGELYNRIWKMLPEDQELNEHLSISRFFPICLPSDQTSVLEHLTDLEQCIVNSIVEQPSWGEQIPKSWVWFSRFIARRKDTHKIMSIKQLKQAQPTVKYIDKQIRSMLLFYHEIGMILHFDEDKLREFFILDIQWFVDAFKHIITDANHMEAVRTPKELNDFHETGELNDDLLNRIWRYTCLKDFVEYKSVILSYMEKLGLLVQGHKDMHFVPSMNKRDFPSQLLGILAGLEDDMKTSVLYFEFAMVPVFVYYRLIVACLSSLKWNPVLDNHKCFYKNVAIFKVDEHCIIIAVSQRYIQLQIYCEENPLDKPTIIRLREKLENTIQILAGTFHDSLEYKTGYSCTTADFGVDLNNTFITEKQMKDLKGKKCPLHNFLTGHSVEPVKFLQWWNPEIKVQDTFQAKEKQKEQVQIRENHQDLFSEYGIVYIAGRIGKEWNLLLLHLGLQQAEIDQIQIDNPGNVKMWNITGIRIWRNRRTDINDEAKRDFFLALKSCDRSDLVQELREKYNLPDVTHSFLTPQTLLNVNAIYRRIAVVKTQDVKGTAFRVGSKYLMSTYNVFREQLETLWSIVHDMLSAEERHQFNLHSRIPPDGPWNLTEVFNRDDVPYDAKQHVHQLGKLLVTDLYGVGFGHTDENEGFTGESSVLFNIPFVSREHNFVILELDRDIPEGIPLYCEENETTSIAHIIGHPRGQLQMQDCQGIIYTSDEALAKFKEEAIDYFSNRCKYDEETLISDYNTCHLKPDQLALHCKQIMNPGSPVVVIDKDNKLKVKAMITTCQPKSVYDSDDRSFTVTREHSKYILASGIQIKLVHEILSKNEKQLCADLFGDN